MPCKTHRVVDRRAVRRMFPCLIAVIALAVCGISRDALSQAAPQAPAPAAPAPAAPAPAAPAPAAPDQKQSDEKEFQRVDPDLRKVLQASVVLGSFVLVAIVTFVIFNFLYNLRKDVAGSSDPEIKKLFPHMAMGLPDGSIRSAVALLIVLGALLALMSGMLPGLGFQVPEALTGIFGTILGFYFGRTGGAESAEATKALKEAVTAGAAAQGQVAAAQGEAQRATVALAASEGAHADTLAVDADQLVAAVASVVDAMPQDAKARVADNLAKGRAAIDAAKTAAKPEGIDAAVNDFLKNGPIAALVNGLGPALAPLVPAGTTVAAFKALAKVTAQLPPAAAQHWTALLLNAPYREGLINPAIDAAYAQKLINRVPSAANLLQQLQSTPASPQAAMTGPLGPVDFVKLALHEGADDTISDMWGGAVARAAVTPVVEGLQRGALEIQLENEIPANLLQELGGPGVFFKTLTTVQSAAGGAGLAALDTFMSMVRAARGTGVPVADLLP